MNILTSIFGRAAILTLVAAPLASAATLHVLSSAGGRGGGSEAAPFRTLSMAVTSAAPGDTIVVHQGNYSVTTPIVVDKPNLKIVGISGERAVFTAGDDVPAVMSIIASGVFLQDITLQGGFYGLKIDLENERPTRGVVIRDCTIRETAADCIKSFNADNLRIESCLIGPSGLKQKDNAEGIDIIGSVGVTIRSCRIQDTATNGIYLKGGTRNGLIEKCMIRNAGHAGILLGQDTDPEYMRDHTSYEAIGCIARNNIIENCLAAGVGAYSAKNVSFTNNTMINVARELQAGFWVVTNGRGVPSEQVKFRGNIVIIGGPRPAMFIKDAAGLPESDYNVFFSRAGEVKFVREISVDNSLNRQWTFAQWRDSCGMDAHSFTSDPKIDAKLFRPMKGSPALSRAKVVQSPEDDYFGARRNSESYDIGAVSASAVIKGIVDKAAEDTQSH